MALKESGGQFASVARQERTKTALREQGRTLMTKTSDGFEIDEALGAIVLDKAEANPDGASLSYHIMFEGPTPKAFVLYRFGKDQNGVAIW